MYSCLFLSSRWLNVLQARVQTAAAAHLNQVVSHGGGDVHTAGETVSGLGQFTFTQQLSASLKISFSATEHTSSRI